MKARKYDYRRNLPHIELSGREHFITFDTYIRWELPPAARDIALKHCLHDNGSKMHLHVAIVMPDHVHMIFMPLEAANGEIFSFQELSVPLREPHLIPSTRLLGDLERSGRMNLLIM